MTAPSWKLWVDTGGTFTDCLAVDPGGALRRAKVLSSGAVRVRIADRVGVEITLAASGLPPGFAVGARCVVAEGGDGARVAAHPEVDRLELDQPVDVEPGALATLDFDVEAPVLAARLVTGTPADRELPPLEIRLATTRGTNALLERRGADVALFVTKGFADLLRIGTQQRPDLFALDIRRPEPLWRAVVEVPERRDARGRVVRPLDADAVRRSARRLAEAGLEVAAIALMHAWIDPAGEEEVESILRSEGFRTVSRSADLSPVLGFESRARTAVVDAYLAPTIGGYLERIRRATRGGRLRVMTSAGGLVDAERYRARDSLLSGPAGGVVAAAACARAEGLVEIIAFDMGGTSTDVSRWSGDLEYRFRTRVGDAEIAAPSLAIETVAAGGGSVCWVDAGELRVGPRSAGAAPGPAAYGAGGPLTLTDVNLLLGRLDPARFRLPLRPAAAAERLAELREELAAGGREVDPDRLLASFLRIADERMAEAVRRVSVRWGHDPRRHALVAFGGAGGQHACAVAELLGIGRVLLPAEAGLLSALGLGVAVVERFAERQVLAPLDEVLERLPVLLRELEEEALVALGAEGVADEERRIRRRMAFLRLTGQETTLEIELASDGSDPRARFEAAYRERYGVGPAARSIELESLRVVASSRPGDLPPPASSGSQGGESLGRTWIDGAWQEAARIDRGELGRCPRRGPLLVLDPFALLVVPGSWSVRRSATGGVLAERVG